MRLRRLGFMVPRLYSIGITQDVQGASGELYGCFRHFGGIEVLHRKYRVIYRGPVGMICAP